MERIICLDFETYYDDECSVRTLGNWAYTHHPKFEAYMLSVYDGENSWVGSPLDFNWDALEGATLIAHNAAFDSSVCAALAEKGLIPHLKNKWVCTANMSAFLCSERSLANALWLLEGIRVSKTIRDEMKGKNFSELPAEEKLALAKYAESDAIHCWNLYNNHGHKWPQFERDLSELTIKQSLRGGAIDVAKLDAYHKAVCFAVWTLAKSLPWVENDDAKPTSPKAVANECRKVGIPCPPLKTEDEEGYELWEKTYSPKFPWVAGVSQYRKLNKLATFLETLKKRLRPDNTIDFSLLYFGAHCVTGDHEVLTRDGWRKIEDWDGGEIAQWSPLGQIRFLPATANRFEVNEVGVELDAPYAKGVFTNGHKIPLWANNGRGDFTTLEAGSARNRSETCLPVGGVLVDDGSITATQMRLLVAVQADGHWTADGILQFTLRKPRKIARIKMLLEELGIPYSIREFPSCRGQFRVSVSRRNCPGWLSKDRKFFGAWLLDSTREARAAFAEEIPLWDGYTGKHGAEYYSSVQGNLEWASTVLHLGGYSARVGDGSLFIRRRATTRAYRKHWESSRRLNEVFCPTTQTGYWVYRYKGTIAVTGNTGRWSGGGAGLNVQNLRKEPLLLKNGVVVADEKDADTIVDVRSLFIPRPGKKFVICDLSQIEPRCLSWVTNDVEFLKFVAAGQSPYEAHARASMGWTGGELKKENKDLYGLAKARVLALGYGCGAEKFITMAYQYAGLVIELERSIEIVNDFRDQNPKITGLWRTLDANFQRSVNGDCEVELPSGRSLFYRKVRRETRWKMDKKTGEKVNKFVYTAQIGSKRYELYGGLLTENLIQAIARDGFGYHLLELERSYGDVIFHVHDEAIVEVDAEVTAKDIEAAMSVTPPWLEGCPLAAEGKEATHYLK